MKNSGLIILLLLLSFQLFAQDFTITKTYVQKDAQLNQLIFTIEVQGIAGDSVPNAIGSLDGAPVLGYVFPTNLSPADVGFDATTGILALAITSHPDFDDTPLWDENLDGNYANDGVEWHAHWVVLENNTAVPGGLAVKATNSNSVLPATNPGMPMYMDSPGFHIIQDGNAIRCVIPLNRMNNQDQFNYDGVTALMYVNTSDTARPMLGVYQTFSVASGNLSLPYEVGSHSCDTLFLDISTSDVGLIQVEQAKIYPNPAIDQVQIELTSGFNLNSYDVRIYNLNGIQVYQTALNANNLSIPTSFIGSAGTYQLAIYDINTGVLKASAQLILL